MQNLKNTGHLPIVLVTIVALFVVFLSSCDLSLPTKLEPPVWRASLTLPLIYDQYPIIDLENDSTFFAQGDTMFLRFGGKLGSVALSQNDFIVPVGQDIPINEPGQILTVPTVNEVVQDIVTLEDIIGSDPSVIPPDVWNSAVSDPIIDVDTLQDFGDETRGLLEEYFSVYALETENGSYFVTEFFNNLPGPVFIEPIRVEVVRDDNSRYDLVIHNGGAVGAYQVLKDSTDLSGQMLEGTRLNASMAIYLLPVVDTLYKNPDIQTGLFYLQSMALGFHAIHGRTREVVLVDTTLAFSLPESNTQIERGQLSVTGPDTNQISMEVLDNTYNAPLMFSLTFPQILSPATPPKPASVPDTLLSTGLELNVDLGGYAIQANEGDAFINALSYSYRVFFKEADPDVPGYNAVLPLNEEMGHVQIAFQVSDLRFDQLSGQFNMLLPGDNQEMELPEGITGIGIAEPEMILRVRNRILPVKLIMDISARKGRQTRTMHVEPSLNYPGTSVTDSALSILKFNKDGLFVYWDDLTNEVRRNETHPTLADLIDLSPERFQISTMARVRGEGSISVGDSLWADYTLEAPFKFLAGSQSFMPKDYTTITAWDSSTAEFIRTNATEAVVYANLTNHIPMHGKFTLLMSDSTIFPLDTTRYTLDSLNILSMRDNWIFFNNGDTVRLDTLFSVPLPMADLDEFGRVAAPVQLMVTDTISAELVQEFTRIVNHYIMPRIDLVTSSDSLIFIRPQDYIGVHAYIGFRVNTGDFIYGSDEENGK
jgi:hypothetical protein